MMRTKLYCSLAAMGLMFQIAKPATAFPPRNPPVATSMPSPRESGIQRASCVLRIELEGDRYNGQPGQMAQTVIAALTSTTLVDPAMKTALDLSPDDWPKVAQLQVEPAGDAAIRLAVLIKTDTSIKVDPAAANTAIKELANRAMRSFNDADKKDDRPAQIEALTAQRTELDHKLSALRTEMNQLSYNSSANPNFIRGIRTDDETVRAELQRNIDAQTSDMAVLEASAAAIDEQLKSLDIEHHPELKDLQVKLITQRSDNRINAAAGKAKLEQLKMQLDKLPPKPAPSTTRSARTISDVQNEMQDVQQQRNDLDQRIAQLRNRGNETPHYRLVLIDGESH